MASSRLGYLKVLREARWLFLFTNIYPEWQIYIKQLEIVLLIRVLLQSEWLFNRNSLKAAW
jgi:hypothetical protein